MFMSRIHCPKCQAIVPDGQPCPNGCLTLKCKECRRFIAVNKEPYDGEEGKCPYCGAKISSKDVSSSSSLYRRR